MFQNKLQEQLLELMINYEVYQNNLKFLYKAEVKWYDLSTSVKIKLKVKFIFWIRFEVLFKANI
jgi:hypothetical protein